MPDGAPNLPARVTEPPRGAHGRWRRSRATAEWDGEVLDRVSRGHSFRRIARDLGYASTASVHAAYKRALRDTVLERAGDQRDKALLRIEKYREMAGAILEAQHPAVSQGSVVRLDGRPVLDATVNLGALDRLVKLEQEEAKLRGTYAPTASKVTKLTDEDLDDLLADEEAAAAEAEAAVQDGGDDAPEADGGGPEPGPAPEAPAGPGAPEPGGS